MSAPHINLSFVLSVYQKLSNLVDIWRTCDKKFVHSFFETRCIDLQTSGDVIFVTGGAT